MLSNYLIFCFLLVLLPSIFPSIRDFSNESDLHNRGLKYWNFSFSLSFNHSNEYLTLISFKVTGLIPLQSNRLSRVFSGTTIKKHRFFGTQPSLQSNSYICTTTTTGTTIALTLGTFVSKVMSLLFNMLSGFVIAFL